MNWWKELKIKVKAEEPLKTHTTFRIGGPAQLYAEPRNLSQLKLLINRAKRYNIPVLIIGCGSNILAADKGVRALVVRLGSSFFSKLNVRGNFVEAGAGVTLARLLSYGTHHGLSGAEFLAGIPGSIGGALVMNAGIAGGTSIGNLVRSVTVMDYNGRTKVLKNEDLKFGYRKSNLSKFIVLGARFKLKKENRQIISHRISGYMALRKDKLDSAHPSAGCIFKNPAGTSAGKLIDLCGLKGKRFGAAYVSRKHANFILNGANAKAADVLALMNAIKKSVKQEFDVDLKPEIKIWQ